MLVAPAPLGTQGQRPRGGRGTAVAILSRNVSSFDEVREICRALPEVEEILTWGSDVTFRVRSKIFAIGGEGADRVSIKATPDAQADLLALDEETFQKAAYVGRYGWVTVRLDRLERGHLEQLLREAWRMTAPKRLRDSVAR
jgi:hypothetical protein